MDQYSFSSSIVLLKYFEEYVIEFLIFIVFPLLFSVIYVDFEFTKKLKFQVLLYISASYVLLTT